MSPTATSADLLLLCATAGEATELALALQALPLQASASRATPLPAPVDVSDITTAHGHFAGTPCRLVYSGIGPVNTAHALTRAVERQRPRMVLQFGIAGAYVPAGVPVGSIVVASEEIYGDLGVLTPDGWQPVDLIGIPVVPGSSPRFNRFPLDPQGVARAVRLLARLPPASAPAVPAPPVHCGPCLTLSQVTGVRTLGDALHRRFGALCESMEGAAAAHVCALYGLLFLEVRGVSNLVEDRDRSHWQIAAAAGAAQRAVLHLVGHVAELTGGQA